MFGWRLCEKESNVRHGKATEVRGNSMSKGVGVNQMYFLCICYGPSTGKSALEIHKESTSTMGWEKKQPVRHQQTVKGVT